MSLITPGHLATPGKLWLPPFKHQPLPMILDIQQVPPTLVTSFLNLGSLDYIPILPLTPEQYKDAFKDLTATYNLPHSSHTARHLFASMQRFLNVMIARIAQAMTHKADTSLSPYLHAISKAEQSVILQHPAYFMPIHF